MTLFPGVSHPTSSLFHLCLCTSLNTCTVGNTLSPMLQTAENTVRGGKTFQQGIVNFSTLLFTFRGRLVQTHTRLPIVSTVIGSTPPSPLPVSSCGLVTAKTHLLRVATSCGANSSRLPWSHPLLHSIVVLHCLSGQCQCL